MGSFYKVDRIDGKNFGMKKMAQEKLEQSQISKLAMKSQLIMHIPQFL